MTDSDTSSDSPGLSGIPSRDGVLILEWSSEDQSVSIEYVDGMIVNHPMTEPDAVKFADSIFGADRVPQRFNDGRILQWRHFSSESGSGRYPAPRQTPQPSVSSPRTLADHQAVTPALGTDVSLSVGELLSEIPMDFWLHVVTLNAPPTRRLGSLVIQ